VGSSSGATAERGSARLQRSRKGGKDIIHNNKNIKRRRRIREVRHIQEVGECAYISDHEEDEREYLTLAISWREFEDSERRLREMKNKNV